MQYCHGPKLIPSNTLSHFCNAVAGLHFTHSLCLANTAISLEIAFFYSDKLFNKDAAQYTEPVREQRWWLPRKTSAKLCVLCSSMFYLNFRRFLQSNTLFAGFSDVCRVVDLNRESRSLKLVLSVNFLCYGFSWSWMGIIL